MSRALKTSAPSSADADSYDAVPYETKPFPQTNPLVLQGIGGLFGLSAPSPYRARILDIGCGTGSNIIAIASLYPQSECVGIDYAARQIEIGQNAVKAYGLTNITLKNMSIMDVDKSFGSFDYILCHGILSWVPKEVQEKLFAVCKDNLTANGIAFLSYNTGPGWSITGVVRDLMAYHTANIENSAEKAKQARQLLSFTTGVLRESKNPMASAIEREEKRLAQYPDYYLLHEYLSEINEPWYFHEFVARVEKEGLQYLAETELEIMFSENLPPAIAQALPSADAVRTQQYMDFLGTRRFRNSLVCRAGQSLAFDASPEKLRQGGLCSRLEYPKDFGAHAIRGGQALSFRSTLSGMGFTTHDPILLALLQVFAEAGHRFLRFDDLLAPLRRKLQQAQHSFDEAALETRLAKECARMIRTRGAVFLLEPPPFTPAISVQPQASSLARNQVMKQDWVTNQMMEDFTGLPPFARRAIHYADGTRTLPGLIQSLLGHFASGELTFSENGTPVTNPAEIKHKLPALLNQTLQRLASMGLLVK